ncbi:MAG: L-2-hydroxyglutarate oxidase [Gammaproteobacteria bacterium]|nr:L-2-hydroxyglutarate oxidase [Gammaproteobacteria bacterium]
MTDICILGAGIVGLSLAHQLLEADPSVTITIIDKEPEAGLHGSGRNSGVLHAGLYYEPTSIKAKVCVAGAKRLKSWCEQEKLPVLKCGKVITPQKVGLDGQLDVLLQRGKANGAIVELIDEQQFLELVPDGRTASGRAIWSPGTCVVKPLMIVQRLLQRLQEKGVKFLFLNAQWTSNYKLNQINFADGTSLSYGHLFNCAGLQADRVAHQFDTGKQYTILPFRGNYWELRDPKHFQFNTNLYPVPDLDIPFLGVHVTPSIDGTIYLGPTATPALGRENYKGLTNVEPLGTLAFSRHMLNQLFLNKKMRRYVQEQAFQWLPNNFLSAAQAIVPKLKMTDIQRSNKVGIRPQLYNKKTHGLVQDFIMLDGPCSTHVINAISPAFTSSFELADLIVEKSKVFNT